MDIGYRDTFFRGESLAKAADAFLRVLPVDVQGLLCTGSSGCAIASAMLTRRCKLFSLYVYKDECAGERKHTANEYAGSRSSARKWAIVDDVIDTGGTVRRLLKFAREHGLVVDCIIVGRVVSCNSSDGVYIPVLEA